MNRAILTLVGSPALVLDAGGVDDVAGGGWLQSGSVEPSGRKHTVPSLWVIVTPGGRPPPLAASLDAGAEVVGGAVSTAEDLGLVDVMKPEEGVAGRELVGLIASVPVALPVGSLEPPDSVV